MYLNKLDVKDFCSIRNDAFVFKPGFNLITGPNGSGKSSVLKALSYALLNTTEKTIADYVNWDAKGFEVGLDFSINDAKSMLKNTYNGRNSNKTLEIGGETYENSDATSKLSAIFDPTLCKYSVFSSQGDLDIIYATPAQRRDLLKTIYNLNFDEALATLEQDEEHINDQIKAIDIKIAELNASLKTDEHELQELPFNAKVAEDYALKCSSNDAEVYKLNQKKQSLDNKQGNTTQYKAQLQWAKSDMERVINNIQRNKEDMDASRDRIEQFPSDKALVTEEYEEQLQRYENALLKIKKVRPPVFNEDMLHQQEATVAALNADLQKALKDIKIMESGICPTCKKPFSQEEILVHQQEADAFQAKLAEGRRSIEQLTKVKVAYLEAVEKNRAIDIDIAINQQNIRATNSSYEQKINSLNDYLQLNQERFTQSQKTSDELSQALIGVQGTIAGLEALLDKSDTSVEEELSLLVNQIGALDKATADYIKLIKLYDETVAVNNKLVALNEALNKTKKVSLKLLNAEKDSKDKFLHELEVIKEGKNVLKKDLPNFILQRLAVGLEVTANEFLDRAYNGRYHIKLVDSKSGIDIVFGEKEKSVLMASGAEKSLINLGIKLGLSKLSGMGILFLDEVDAYMAEDIAGEVFDVFQDLISQKFIDQIFVISHKESVKELLEENYNANVFVMGG